MDYSKMKATKTTKTKSSDITVSKSSKSHAKRALKRAGLNWIVVILFLIFGLLGGYLGMKVAFANDTYEMIGYENGEADVYIGLDEEYQTYEEKGVKCIAFGKDVSSECTVTYYFRQSLTEEPTQVEEVDEETEGIYYAVYNCPNSKYSSVKLIRNIIILRGEDDA